MAERCDQHLLKLRLSGVNLRGTASTAMVPGQMGFHGMMIENFAFVLASPCYTRATITGHFPSSIQSLMTDEAGEITRILGQARDGNREALERLITAVYQELRRLAEYYMQHERQEHSLQATELVHEAYLRLVGQDAADWQNRLHFFAVAARVMRRLLVDHARARQALKRGAGSKIALGEAPTFAVVRSDELLRIEDALQGLARIDPHQARIVELRYFAGLSIEEVAEVLGISGRTVRREWLMAKAWLRAEVQGL